MTWQEIKNKYPDANTRGDTMPFERELQYVNDCFDAYESEGFSDIFWTPYDSESKNIGRPFKVVGRVPLLQDDPDGADIECLPMWKIEFEDGETMAVYPEEIVPTEMVANGCQIPMDNLRTK